MSSRNILTTGAAQLLKLAAAGRDTLLPNRKGAVVLLYHRVGGTSSLAVDLPSQLFAAQIDELATEQRIISLGSLLGAVSHSDVPAVDPPAVDPVAITFDDGTADFADVAMPVLVRAAAPVTLYVATDFVDRAREFPHRGIPLSWAALRDVVATGLVTVGSHTHTHALLDRLAPEEVVDELDRSIKLIEDHLGVTPEHFAYPKALLGSPAAQAAVRARFRSAAVAGTRPNLYRSTDPYRLSRSPVQAGDGMRWFRHKARGGLALEDDVRQLVNRRRYVGAVT